MPGSRVFLTHQSASQYWIHHDVYASRKTNCIPTHADVPNHIMLADAARVAIGHRGPVHAAIASRSDTRVVSNGVLHMRTVPYPKGSFYKAVADVYVASPELCFLQAATVLDFQQLLMYGYELCGTYARTPAGQDTRYQRDPLTTAADIQAYLQKSTGANGVKQALRACAHLADGSASPRESELTAMMSLPPRLEGYGLPLPFLNYGIPVDAPDPDQPGQKLVLHGDIVWPSAHLIVEYDGGQHGELDNHSLDKQRDHLLLDAGYETVRITEKSISKPEEMARLAATINKQGQYRRKATALANTDGKIILQQKLLTGCDLPWLQIED